MGKKLEDMREGEAVVTIGMTVARAILSVFIALAILSSIVIVQTGTVGIVMEFGRIKEVIQPGLHFVIPVITNVQVMNTQTMKYEVNASAATNDLQDVRATIAVNYHLSNNDDGIIYLFNQFRGAHEDRIIAPVVQEVVKANTAKFTADNLIKTRSAVKDSITRDLENKLSDKGIYVEEVSITNFDFSPQFNQAIENKAVIEQEKLQAQLELEKKQIEVQKMVVEQNATAQALVIQAEADAKAKSLRAEGEANATLVTASANKQAIDLIQGVLTDEYVRYQYAQRWDGKLPYFMGAGQSSFLIPLNNS